MHTLFSAVKDDSIRAGRSIFSVGLILAFFLTYLAGTSPGLHAWLHAEEEAGCGTAGCAGHHAPTAPDSESEDSELPDDAHFCGLIVFAAGFLADAPSPSPGEPEGFRGEAHAETNGVTPPRTAYFLPQGRAPPVIG